MFSSEEWYFRSNIIKVVKSKLPSSEVHEVFIGVVNLALLKNRKYKSKNQQFKYVILSCVCLAL